MDEYTLKSAGLTNEEIEKLVIEDSVLEKQKVLKKIRFRIINEIHKEQKKVDALDYILYQLQNGGDTK